MSVMMTSPISGPAVWKGADMAGDTSWLHVLSPEAIAALDAALAHVKARGLRFPDFGKDDFPLVDDVLNLKQHSDELENGRGFFGVARIAHSPLQRRRHPDHLLRHRPAHGHARSPKPQG